MRTMRTMDQKIVKELKAMYPAGTRVELVRMEDIQAPAIGTKGTVMGVDDLGNIRVRWDNGSHLSVVYQEDECRKIAECQETTALEE